ncbi:MAG: AAA family ATPase [bacterium]
MAYVIAVAGKGGVGKTSITCHVIGALRDMGKTPILAVDADPNSNLNELLGVAVRETIADVIEETKDAAKNLPPGFSKERYMEERINSAVIESEGFDLFVMGRPGGPGCYCYPNMMLRKFLDEVSAQYSYIVLDNEAGMEHISRRTSRKVDALLIVSDPSLAALRAAGRIRDTARLLGLNVAAEGLVVNMTENGLPESAGNEIERLNLRLFGSIPFDEEVYRRSLDGTPLLDVPPDKSPSRMSVARMLRGILRF